MKPGFFLDRDGIVIETRVVNNLPVPIAIPREVRLVNGLIDFVDEFSKMFTFVIVTNQPDIARGSQTKEGVEAIHSKIRDLVAIDNIYTCFHDDLDGCKCRKPKPGLILKAASDLELDLSKSYLAGDRWRDIEAGQAVGMKNFFFDYGYNEKLPNGEFTKVTSFGEIRDILRAL